MILSSATTLYEIQGRKDSTGRNVEGRHRTPFSSRVKWYQSKYNTQQHGQTPWISDLFGHGLGVRVDQVRISRILECLLPGGSNNLFYGKTLAT